MARAQQITQALDRFTETGTPPASPFSDGVGLMWMSPLCKGGLPGRRFVPERLGTGDARADAEQRYAPLSTLEDAPGALRPPHQTVLRVTPSLYYAIPSWRYQAGSFSVFVWARIAKFYTQRAVIVADWAPPSCMLFAVTGDRRLALALRGTPPASYDAAHAPGRPAAARAVLDTEELLLAQSPAGAVHDDTWTHLGFSFDLPAGEARLYIDGQVAATQRAAGGARPLPFHLRPHLCLGYSDADQPGAKDAGCYGFLSDVRFYRGALRLDEHVG